MFTREISLYNYKLIIFITEQPVMNNEVSFLFGNPLISDDFLLEKDNFQIGNSLKGHWLKLDIEEEKITLTNDILGGFRVYYHKNKDTIFISDNYNFILEKANILYKKNEIEYEYWLKHRFTTGSRTFIQGLHKISPASIFKIAGSGINEKTYFKNITRKPNREFFKKTVHNDFLDTFASLKKNPKQKILLFSGGKDSCLLLQYLLKLNISFKAVFFKMSPMDRFIAEDLNKVREIAKKLKIEVDVLDIEPNEISKDQQSNIARIQLFDRHFSLLHYLGVEKLIKKYGEDILIINGQSSDSILSFGPSENSLMSYFRRHIMYNSKLISKIGVLLLNIKTKEKFRLPTSPEERLVSLFDEFKYARVIDTKLAFNYYKYLEDYIKQKTNILNTYCSKEMLVKILSFCQGSDNQVVVNSAKLSNASVIMPFATPNIIYSTIKYKNENLEIEYPKYVIGDILKEIFNFNYPKLTSKVNSKQLKVGEIIDFEEFIKKYADQLFVNK